MNTYKVFVTGVPVNIHRNSARSWATTLLARVPLKHEMSPVAKHIKLNDTPIPDELRLVKHDAVPFHTCQETTTKAALGRATNKQINDRKVSPMFGQISSFVIGFNVRIFDNEVETESVVRCDDDLFIYMVR